MPYKPVAKKKATAPKGGGKAATGAAAKKTFKRSVSGVTSAGATP